MHAVQLFSIICWLFVPSNKKTTCMYENINRIVDVVTHLIDSSRFTTPTLWKQSPSVTNPSIFSLPLKEKSHSSYSAHCHHRSSCKAHNGNCSTAFNKKFPASLLQNCLTLIQVRNWWMKATFLPQTYIVFYMCAGSVCFLS